MILLALRVLTILSIVLIFLGGFFFVLLPALALTLVALGSGWLGILFGYFLREVQRSIEGENNDSSKPTAK